MSCHEERITEMERATRCRWNRTYPSLSSSFFLRSKSRWTTSHTCWASSSVSLERSSFLTAMAPGIIAVTSYRTCKQLMKFIFYIEHITNQVTCIFPHIIHHQIWIFRNGIVKISHLMVALQTGKFHDVWLLSTGTFKFLYFIQEIHFMLNL